MAILQQLQGNEDFADLLAELTWTGRSYVGTQRAVERITGLAQSTIRQGLSLDPGRAAGETKLLKWLVAQGVSVRGIQKEWQTGAIKDAHIAVLIRYAATESQTKPAEAQRWQRLIEAVGFRQVIHELSGREDLTARKDVRMKNLPTQRSWVDRLLQAGSSIGKSRAQLVQGLLRMQPQKLEKALRDVFPEVPKSTNWRTHADKDTLLLVNAAESLAAVTGDIRAGSRVRQVALEGGWSGGVDWQKDPIDTKSSGLSRRS